MNSVAKGLCIDYFVVVFVDFCAVDGRSKATKSRLQNVVGKSYSLICAQERSFSFFIFVLVTTFNLFITGN